MSARTTLELSHKTSCACDSAHSHAQVCAIPPPGRCGMRSSTTNHGTVLDPEVGAEQGNGNGPPHSSPHSGVLEAGLGLAGFISTTHWTAIGASEERRTGRREGHEARHRTVGCTPLEVLSMRRCTRHVQPIHHGVRGEVSDVRSLSRQARSRKKAWKGPAQQLQPGPKVLCSRLAAVGFVIEHLVKSTFDGALTHVHVATFLLILLVITFVFPFVSCTCRSVQLCVVRCGDVGGPPSTRWTLWILGSSASTFGRRAFYPGGHSTCPPCTWRSRLCWLCTPGDAQ